MTLYKTLLAALLLSACASVPRVDSVGCADFKPCYSQSGIAVLADKSTADPILASAQEGAKAFTRFFGVEITPIAIVPGGEITGDMQMALTDAGYNVSLPWISAADKVALTQSSIRQQVMEQTKGMPTAQQEAIIKMALAKADASKSGKSEVELGDMSATERGVLTHELGHMWFMAAFKLADDNAASAHGYGGWAPDWLDEMAAVLLENDVLTHSRRKAFKTLPAEDLYPLEEFLTMEHPALKAAQALKDKIGHESDTGGSRAIILSGEEGEAFLKASAGSNPANFYTQVRGFADYVMTSTGDEQVFAKLAMHLSEGGTIESWLSTTDGLANDIEALSKEWAEWVKAR